MKTKLFMTVLLSSCFAWAGNSDIGSSSIEKTVKQGQTTIQHRTCHVQSFTVSNDPGFTNDFTQAGRVSYNWIDKSRFGNLIQKALEPVTEENKHNMSFDDLVVQRLTKNGFKFDETTSYVYLQDQDEEDAIQISLAVDANVKLYGIAGDDSFTTSYYSAVRAFQVKNGKVSKTYAYGANSKIFKNSPYVPTSNSAIAAHYDAVVEAALSNLPTCSQK